MRAALIPPRAVPGAPWAFDYSAYTKIFRGHGSATAVASGATVTLFDESFTGYIAWMQLWDLATAVAWTVTLRVDGTDYSLPRPANIGPRVALPMWLPVKSGARLQVSHGAGVSRDIYHQWLLLDRTSAPDLSKLTLLDAGSYVTVTTKTANTALQDVVNIADAGWFWWAGSAMYANANDGKGDGRILITIDGSAAAANGWNEQVICSTNTVVPPVGFGCMGPLRFATSLRVQHRTTNANAGIQTQVLYQLDP